MKVKDILRTKGSKVITASINDSILGAVRVMVENSVGSVLLLDADGKPFGIFTERDVLRQVAENPEKLDRMQIKDVVYCDPYVCVPDDDLDSVMELMTEKRFRHVPVMEEGKLIGIISIGDIVKALHHSTQFELRHMRDYIMGKI